MSFLCEWCDCDFTSGHFDIFYAHVRDHTKHFIDKDSSSDGKAICQCQWRECFADSCENIDELTRHVLFHGYHAKLKHLGLQAQTAVNLSSCLLDSQARNLIPEFPEEFSCQWEHCDAGVTCCPKFFYRHIEIHTEENKPQGPFNFFSCKWKNCLFVSKRRNKLKEHCRTHTHEKCFGCPNCGGLFSNKTKFMDHLRRQNTMESESYQCSHCFKFFASERILRDHMRQHVNYYKCSLCNMTCPTKSGLQHHVNFRHSDEKPYSCDLCDSSFKSGNDLGRHLQTHNPVCDFNCEEEHCSYVTNTLQNLRRHYKVNHENQCSGRYECHICGNRYSRGAGLTKHLKKKHTFRWPTGHSRFRYKEHEDGLYRLQTVRFESVELSQQLDALEHDADVDEVSTPQDNVTPDDYEEQIDVNRQTTSDGNESTSLMIHSSAPNISTASSSTHEHLLDMLNQFTAHYDPPDTRHCHGTASDVCSRIVVATGGNSDIDQLTQRENSKTPSREEIAAHAVLDLQEAASVLAQLSDSRVTNSINNVN